MIARMIRRYVQPRLRQLLGESPAVVLVGPRQAGKTTLALSIASSLPPDGRGAGQKPRLTLVGREPWAS